MVNSVVLTFRCGVEISERGCVSVMELKSGVDPSGEFCAFSLCGSLLSHLHMAPYTPKLISLAQVQGK